jgi:hypothetical protein
VNRIPHRYDLDAGRSSPMYPVWRMWVHSVGTLPYVNAMWRQEETEWLGNATRQMFGLLVKCDASRNREQ